MNYILKNETTKLMKQQVILKQSVSLALLIIGSAFATKSGKFEFLSPENMIPSLFNSGWLIVFFMVYLTSQIFSMEFRYGTIKNLIKTKKSHQQLFFAKILTLTAYSLYLNLLAVLLTIVLSFLLFPRISLGGFFQQNAIIQTLCIHTFSGFVGMWLFASLSLMLSLFIKNEALAGMLGLTTYFLASMIAGIQFMLLDQFSWLKWNPFNMLNLANQLINNKLEELTLLSTNQLLIGNVCYILIFIMIAGIVFKRKPI